MIPTLLLTALTLQGGSASGTIQSASIQAVTEPSPEIRERFVSISEVPSSFNMSDRLVAYPANFFEVRDMPVNHRNGIVMCAPPRITPSRFTPP